MTHANDAAIGSGENRPPRVLTLAVALPGTLAALALLLWLVALVLDVPIVAGGRPLTLAEAAAIGDRAGILLLLKDGADPNSEGHVRAGLIDLTDHQLTPLAAATASRQPAVLRQLIDSGARISPANYPALWCAAAGRLNNGEVLAFLETQADHRTPVDCPTAR